MKELQESIVTKYKTSDLYINDINLYFMIAPEDVNEPYIVFSIISDITESQFVERYENILIQFSCYSSNSSSLEVNNLFNGIKTIYDDCNLVVDGYNLVSFVREFSFINLDEEKTIWQYIIQYRVILEKNI